MLFACFAVFPFGFKYLLSFSSDDLKPVLSMAHYFSMVLKMLLACGIVFQLTPGPACARYVWHGARGSLYHSGRHSGGPCGFAAVLTPSPDIFSQLLMPGPLMVLYGAGVVAAGLFGKRKTSKGEEDGK